MFWETTPCGLIGSNVSGEKYASDFGVEKCFVLSWRWRM